MKIESVEKVKKSNAFQPWDLALYGVLLLAIIISFAFLTIKNSSDKKIVGVEITYQNAVIGRYILSDGWQELGSAEGVFVTLTENGEETEITINSPQGFNELTVNKTTGIIYMVSADCFGEDCTKMKIEKSSDAIICVPHRIVVTPIFDDELYIPPEIIV